jgi:hypothetical protein
MTTSAKRTLNNFTMILKNKNVYTHRKSIKNLHFLSFAEPQTFQRSFARFAG